MIQKFLAIGPDLNSTTYSMEPTAHACCPSAAARLNAYISNMCFHCYHRPGVSSQSFYQIARTDNKKLGTIHGGIKWNMCMASSESQPRLQAHVSKTTHLQIGTHTSYRSCVWSGCAAFDQGCLRQADMASNMTCGNRILIYMFDRMWVQRDNLGDWKLTFSTICEWGLAE